MIKIIKATNSMDFECISKLAKSIWHEHYKTIISLEQIEYMLAKFNSVKAIELQIKQEFLFFCVFYKDVPVGYLAVKKETDYLFLSKLYVLKLYRGKKIGKAAMQYVMDLADAFNLKKVVLHVNRFNYSAMLVYEKMGFVTTKTLVSDIGNGYIMDDFVMERVGF